MKPGRTPLFSEAAIQRQVRALAVRIDEQYRDMPVTLLVILNGALMFAADLARALHIDPCIDCLHAHSYLGTESTGTPEVNGLRMNSIRGRHVIIVEDIVDTGRTAAALITRVQEQQPASTTLCALLDKPSRRVVTVQPDYVGFPVDDIFIVGYGLDYNGAYRSLPALYGLE